MEVRLVGWLVGGLVGWLVELEGWRLEALSCEFPSFKRQPFLVKRERSEIAYIDTYLMNALFFFLPLLCSNIRKRSAHV